MHQRVRLILFYLDLVSFDSEKAESIASEDFIVVSKYFDLNVPLDESCIEEHELEHERSGTVCGNSCLWEPPSGMHQKLASKRNLHYLYIKYYNHYKISVW